MICPHCNTAIRPNFDDGFNAVETIGNDIGFDVSYDHCPECKKLIILAKKGTRSLSERTWVVHDIVSEEFLYPIGSARPVASEVPDSYKGDYLEACQVFQLSPKASAALSRRLLQRILTEQFRIQEKDLSKQIEKFNERKDTPAYLADAIDAIRNVGNFAAHPLKDTNTGEIVDVEPGEAEWLLDVLDSLFDYAFVQPKRLEEKKLKLDSKLASLGKSPMKGAPKPTS